MDYENQTIIKLSDAPIIINQLKKSDLSPLFNLNLELNHSSVENLKKVCYEIPVLISFDWKNWDKGIKAFNEKNFKNHPPIFLFKMLTFIIRRDRVWGNFIYSCLKEGIIQQIISEIENNFMNNEKNKD